MSTICCLYLFFFRVNVINAANKPTTEAGQGRFVSTVEASTASTTSIGSDPGHRIVDAKQIHPEERFPFLVIFNFHPAKHAKCTGSLIAPMWILSAAHCLGQKVSTFQVYVCNRDDDAAFFPLRIRSASMTAARVSRPRSSWTARSCPTAT